MRLIITLLACLSLLAGCEKSTKNTADNNSNNPADTANTIPVPASVPPASYVGGQVCQNCHQDQTRLWQDSHHDLAMQVATPESVVGDFDNTSFNYFGTISKFTQRDNKFFVTTDGPNGELTEYSIAYTFGVEPLQQYMVEFPNGKIQVLSIAWDARSESEGGQRWYHLYPDEKITHDDELHWTGLQQNWNYMCADCHSTNLQKNYNLSSKSYNTTWSDINVNCEACHGPGSKHVDWAQNPGGANNKNNKGFLTSFNEHITRRWEIDPNTGSAKPQSQPVTHNEVETCAACHSRRLTSFPGVKPHHRFTDYFQPALLTEGLYHPDGQIDGEVYVYGSFLQSKMYHAGVTCSNCHEPHSVKLRFEGNTLCAQCHAPAHFDKTEHHLHTTDAAPQCVDCHMPEKTYMGVDPRRDHSFRIPRPDLSVSLNVPNACVQCHADKSNQWAADAIKKVHGTPPPHPYAHALAAGQYGIAGADQLLTGLLLDDSIPEIVRATAVSFLPRYLSQQTAPVLQTMAQSNEPLIGLALADAADEIQTNYRAAFAVPLLYDQSRVTRAVAGQSVAELTLSNMTEEIRQKKQQSIADYKASALFNADRPESLTNLAGLYVDLRDAEQAEYYYRQAIATGPYYTPAYVNFADFYRQINNEQAGREVLRSGLDRVREKATLLHSLGLSLVRENQLSEAMIYLQQAAEKEQSSARYVYVYAIALNSNGKPGEAVTVLEKGLEKYPGDVEIISGLASIYQDTGNAERSEYYQGMLR